MGDPWRRNWLLTPNEIAALRRRAKDDAVWFRKAFAGLRQKAEAEAEARRVQRLTPSWTADGAFKGFETD